MRYALVNNKRVEASHGLSALCPACAQPMVAKCGDRRVHHWAYRGRRTCDHWWEPETRWHRQWKSRFPADWQEFVRLKLPGNCEVYEDEPDQEHQALAGIEVGEPCVAQEVGEL